MAFQYNPKRIVGSWSGQIAGGRDFAAAFNGGFMDDQIITASYNSDRVTEHEGADGTVTLVLSGSDLATLSIFLVQGNPLNDYLSQLTPSKTRAFLPTGVMNWKDLDTGTTVIKSPTAYIKTSAPIEYGNEVKGREWVFGLVEAELVVGGGVTI